LRLFDDLLPAFRTLAALASILFTCFYSRELSLLDRAGYFFACHLLNPLKDYILPFLHERSEAAASSSKGEGKDISDKKSLWWHVIEHASDCVSVQASSAHCLIAQLFAAGRA
jgi:hypothetical protein